MSDKSPDWERLEFVENRDGLAAADKFAEQTLAVYVEASIKQGPYKKAIEECRRWLECNGDYKVTLVKVEKIDAEPG